MCVGTYVRIEARRQTQGLLCTRTIVYEERRRTHMQGYRSLARFVHAEIAGDEEGLARERQWLEDQEIRAPHALARWFFPQFERVETGGDV